MIPKTKKNPLLSQETNNKMLLQNDREHQGRGQHWIQKARDLKQETGEGVLGVTVKETPG